MNCPFCSGTAKLSKTSLDLFGKAITLKENPVYKCSECKEEFATGEMADKTLEKAKNQFAFCRKIVSTGGSLAITIPTDLAKYYKLGKGKKIELVPSGEKVLKIKVH